MSQYKSKHIFKQTLDQNEPVPEELTATQQFRDQDKFVPAATQNTEAEMHPSDIEIEPLIRPSAKKRWFMPSVLTAFVGLLDGRLLMLVFMLTLLVTGCRLAGFHF